MDGCWLPLGRMPQEPPLRHPVHVKAASPSAIQDRPVSRPLAPPCPSRRTSAQSPPLQRLGPSCIRWRVGGDRGRGGCCLRPAAGTPSPRPHAAAKHSSTGSKQGPWLSASSAGSITALTQSQQGRGRARCAHQCGPQTPPAHAPGLELAGASRLVTLLSTAGAHAGRTVTGWTREGVRLSSQQTAACPAPPSPSQ